MIETSLREEKYLIEEGYLLVGGVDEVGRGPLAGPVTAALVIFPPDLLLAPIKEVVDSKAISEKKRETLSGLIKNVCLSYSIASASANEIDEIGIVPATHLAMKRAIESSIVEPHYLLVDGLVALDLKIPSKAIVKGDQISSSIAAASIIAKVSRDHEMAMLHYQFPQYAFRSNKGYGTKAHLDGLRTIGPSSIHRKTFGPVAAVIEAR
jgi:ribonuclease HII